MQGDGSKARELSKSLYRMRREGTGAKGKLVGFCSVRSH